MHYTTPYISHEPYKPEVSPAHEPPSHPKALRFRDEPPAPKKAQSLEPEACLLWRAAQLPFVASVAPGEKIPMLYVYQTVNRLARA